MAFEIVLPVPSYKRAKPVPTKQHVWRVAPGKPVLGLIDNSKFNASNLLESLARNLVERGFAASWFIIRKPNGGVTITESDRKKLFAEAGVIIAGVGDCGACSSCTVLDSIMMSEMGLPSTAIISTPFKTLARMTCENRGCPEHGVLVVEHPIFTRKPEWLEQQAGGLIEPFLKIIQTTTH